MGQRFTQAQVDLALRKEQLILRVERGESLEAVSQDLGLAYHPKHVSRLRRRYIAGGRHWVALVDGREGRATKITAEIVKWIITELQRDPELTATSVRRQIREVFQVEVSGSHVRQLVLNLGHAGRRGRPGRSSPLVAISTAPVSVGGSRRSGVGTLSLRSSATSRRRILQAVQCSLPERRARTVRNDASHCFRTRVRQSRWCADSDSARVTFENGIFPPVDGLAVSVV